MASRAPSDSTRWRAGRARGEARRARYRSRYHWHAAGLAAAGLLLGLGGCRVDDLVNPHVPDVGTETPLPGSAERLEFSRQPDDIRVGDVFAPIEVVARDEDGRVATDFTGMISVTIDESDGDATLRGTTGRPAVGGVAVFANLSLDRPGRFRLAATAHGVSGAVSESFDVRGAGGRPVRLDLAGGESQTDTINATLGTPYVVRVLDDAGAPVPGVTIRWHVESGGGTITPESAVTDDAGRASARHTLGGSAGDQRVDAAVQGDGALRATFVTTAVHGAPASLRFTQQPSDTEEDERIRPPVSVTALDRLGNLTTRSNAEVKVALVVFSSRGDARLRGGTDRRLRNGTAVFEDLRVDREGVFQLRARLGDVTAESGIFRVFDD